MMNDKKIEESVRLFLEGIGENVNRKGLLDTPARVTRMCHQIYEGLNLNPGKHLQKQFASVDNNMVIEKDITFYSICEHHLLPFNGKAHVAYIPNGKIVGLSKLARTVEVYSRRAQIQENMTAQIADAIEKYLNPKGIMVMIEAEHLCMTMRGVQKPGTETVTIMIRGVFSEDFQLQQTFFQMVKG
ncbi:MAG: GTP cyclohydrolase I FolE [Lachnospiraceae bacterium]|nr:GTP cyclohydrolase I FolE [Lachnospiraceae bacterium]